MLNITEKYINEIKKYFNDTNGKVAVIGISGGKDSSVAAALCVHALGKENVLGVLMPNGCQVDIKDSYKLCEFLGIEYITVNIRTAYNSIISYIENQTTLPNKRTDKIKEISKQTEINLQPRLRMSSLYAVAQSIKGGRVINTTNKCESFVGYGTLFGDTVGDFAPLADLLVYEVIIIGKDLGLPEELVYKTPSDGLSGKSDEEKLGVNYNDIEDFIRNKGLYTNDNINQKHENWDKIRELHEKSQFKRDMIHIPFIER